MSIDVHPQSWVDNDRFPFNLKKYPVTCRCFLLGAWDGRSESNAHGSWHGSGIACKVQAEDSTTEGKSIDPAMQRATRPPVAGQTLVQPTQGWEK